MPIPLITEHGYLPPGVHHCDMEEAKNRFGAGPSRERLWQQFVGYVERIRECGLFVQVIVDGSFISAEDDVRDIDVALVPRLLTSADIDDFRKYTNPQIKNELYEDFRVRTCFATNPPIGRNFFEWFQNIKARHASRFGGPEEARKGILLVNL